MRACAIRGPRAAAFEATGRLRPSSAGRVARRARSAACPGSVPVRRRARHRGRLAGPRRACHRADRRDRAVLAGPRAAGEDRAQAPPSRSATRSRRCACCRSCSAACSGRSRGCGHSRSPWHTALPTAPTSTRTTTTRWPRSTATGKLLREEIFHLREELEAMEARGALPPKLRALKDELARLRLADAAERAPAVAAEEGKRVDGSPPPRHLLVLRLADLHQAEVAAVEHGDAGHRRHHPDRRAGRADPAAEHLRAVVVRRARLQVHDADRLAGQGPGDRGAGRGGQPCW